MGPAEPTPPSGAAERRGFVVVIAGLVALALFPIWAARFPAIQDYPYHLAQVAILDTAGDPRFDYDAHFDAGLRAAPYTTFYTLAVVAAKLMPLEVAGKTVLSLYLLLVGGAILLCGGRARDGRPSWLLPLLLPLALNQTYYLGFVNFLLSLPVLLVAVWGHERLCRNGATPAALAAQFLAVLVLFYTHPFTLLVFVGLAAVGAVLDRRGRGGAWGLAPPLVGVGLFVIWFLLAPSAGGAASGPRGVLWAPLLQTLAFYGSAFTGMRWLDGVDAISLLLWAGVATLAAHAVAVAPRASGVWRERWPWLLVLTTLGVFVFPFRMGHYSYISWRIAAVSYLFVALLAGRLRLAGARRALAVGLVAGLLLAAAHKQARISAEIGEIAPIVERIPPNAAILPLVFDNDSPELERAPFAPHLHLHHYYHVLVGGGVSPYFLLSSLTPVQYRAGARPPAPGEYRPDRFRWELHGESYDYFLTRAADERFLAYLARRAEPVARSGAWQLFRRRDAGNSSRPRDRREHSAPGRRSIRAVR